MTRFPNLVEIPGSPNRCSKTESPIPDQKTISPNLIHNTGFPIQRKTGSSIPGRKMRSSKTFLRIRQKIQGHTFLVRRSVLPIYSKRQDPQSSSENWNTDSFIRRPDPKLAQISESRNPDRKMDHRSLIKRPGLESSQKDKMPQSR